MTKKRIKITQTQSSIGRLKKHKECLKGLGLRKIGHTVEVADNASTRGLINRISYMINVQEID